MGIHSFPKMMNVSLFILYIILAKLFISRFGGYFKAGLLLSGGMDSTIIASFLPGCGYYIFRFLSGDYQREGLQRAKRFA